MAAVNAITGGSAHALGFGPFGGPTLKRYDPSEPPDPDDWLATNEARRIDLVSSYHRRAGFRLPSLRAHSTFHVIVENQLATAESVVVETLERLQREGLDRHDAIHAIGAVLAEQVHSLLQQSEMPSGPDPNTEYFKGLEKLTAAGWRAAYSSMDPD